MRIENHGGLSSTPGDRNPVDGDGQPGAISGFCLIRQHYEADRDEAVRQMMPYAKAVSFERYDLGPNGKETKIDVDRMMEIVADAGYRGYLGTEYEGNRASEWEGYFDGLLTA